MKKKMITLFFICILLFISLCGCVEIPSVEKTDEDMKSEILSEDFPDLIIEDLIIPTELIYSDDPIEIHAIIRNNGNKFAEDISVLFYYQNGTEVGHTTIEFLGPGQKEEVVVASPIQKIGNITIFAQIDTENQIVEQNEINNEAMKKMVVEISPGSYLTPDNLTLSPIVIRINNPLQETGSMFGKSVAGIGDVNNDGKEDLVIGAPGLNKVYVFSGSDFNLLYTIDPPYPLNPEQLFGFVVTSIGDVNYDGIEDLAVGGPLSESVVPLSEPPDYPSLAGYNDFSFESTIPWREMGCTFIFSGSDGSLIHDLYPTSEWEFQYFGHDITCLGDINNDNIPDIAVGASSHQWLHSGGSVFAFSGADGSELWHTWEGFVDDISSFGYYISWIGSVNEGSAERDLLVAAIAHDSNPDPDHSLHAGRVWILEGTNGAYLRLHDNYYPADSDWFGGRLGSVGDQNGDGIDDYVIGERGRSGYVNLFSTIYLFSGKDGSLIRMIESPVNETDNGEFSFVKTEDIDGDFIDDFWVGAKKSGCVLLMNHMGNVIANVFDPNPNNPGDFGYSISVIENLGGGHGSDILVGKPGEYGEVGAAFIIMPQLEKTKLFLVYEISD